MIDFCLSGRVQRSRRTRFQTGVAQSLCAIFLLVAASATHAADQSLALNPAQRQWVAAHKTVRIAPNPDLIPIDGIDVEGHERGLSADYLKLIGTRTGIEFRVDASASRGDRLRALRERRVDLLPAVFEPTIAEPGTVNSAAYLRLSAAIYARAGEPGFETAAQLDGHTIAVVETAAWTSLLGTESPKAKLQKFADVGTALSALRDKAVDAYVGDPFTTGDALERAKLDRDILLSGQLTLEAPLTFAVRSDWPMLLEILNAALKSISVDDEKTLRQRWLQRAPATAAPDTAAPALPPPQAAAVDAALQALEKAREVNAETRKQAEKLLHQAQADEASADQIALQWQSIEQLAAGAESSAEKLEESLATTDTGALLAWRAALPERGTVEQLETLLARERDELATTRAAAAALQAEIDRQTARPTQLRAELTEAQTAIDQSGAAPAPSGTDSVLAQAMLIANQATARLAASRVALLTLENRTYEPRMRLLAAQLRERQRVISEREQHVVTLEALVLDRTGSAISELRTRVTRERDEAVKQFRALGESAAANLALVEQLDSSVHALGALRTQYRDWENWQHDTAQALKNTEERIRIGGVSEAVGLILLAEKNKLKPLPLLKRSLAKLQTELAQTRIRLIDLREQQEALADLGGAVAQAMSHLPEQAPERANDLRTALYRLLATRAEILPSLILQQTRLATEDTAAEQSLHDLVATTERLGLILEARLVWSLSQKPVDAEWLSRVSTDAAAFFAPRRWLRVTGNVAETITAQPIFATACAALLVFLGILRWRLGAQLERLAAPMRRVRTDRYWLTSQALLWTILAAAPLPVAIWMLGYFCRQASTSGNLTEETGLALNAIVTSAFALSFLRALCRENGLAQLHFRWPRPRREALRNVAPWMALIILPTQFLLITLFLRGRASPIDTIGRSALSIAALAMAIVLWRLFAPGRVWTLRDTKLVEPVRIRQALRIALSAGCVLITLLVLRGFFVTASTLSEHALESAAALLAISIAYGLAVRWLVLGERRLALKRMEQKREIEDQARGRVDGDGLPDPEPEEVDLPSVSAQTRRLLRALTIVAVVSSGLWLWSDVTPALTMLDEVPVWGGEPNITLLGVLKGLIVLTLTWVATRNLPGLLEVGVLRRFNIDAATRYAVTSLTRYILVFAGTTAGLSLLGFRWSNLQWLAAGFSVGLGFGMQEIFANFISGLMVLFERPFSVGDVVTIGTVDGVVSRIRTRATTIIDWENREILVPNKSFITERLINWTLSDKITRVSIKVGIAYRSDPRRAQQLLLEVAAAHPEVLAEPAPTAWLMGFGASTMDFDLRVCLADVNERGPVSTDLRMRIAEAFGENDIEIAFPQMEVSLRTPVRVESVPAPPPPAPEEKSQSKD